MYLKRAKCSDLIVFIKFTFYLFCKVLGSKFEVVIPRNDRVREGKKFSALKYNSCLVSDRQNKC